MEIDNSSGGSSEEPLFDEKKVYLMFIFFNSLSSFIKWIMFSLRNLILAWIAG